MMLEGPDIDRYIDAYLPDGKKEEFRDGYQEAVEEKDPEAFKASVKQQLAKERDHGDLVRGVASGFHQDKDAPGYKSKFKFAAVNPLKYIRTTPADVLLARTVHREWIQLCVIACEVGDERVREWTDNINSIHELFSQDSAQSAILDHLGQSQKELDGIQYVTLLPPDDFESVRFNSIDRNVDPSMYAIWSCEIDDGNDLCHEAGNLIHQELEDTVEGCFPYDDEEENPIEFTLHTEPEIPLKKIAYQIVYDNKRIHDAEEPLEFNRSHFRNHFADRVDLLCPQQQAEELIDKRVEYLLGVGEDIGVISTRAPNTNKTYRWMYTGSDDPFDTEDAVRDKYIDEASQTYVQQLAFDEIKEEFDGDIPQQGLEEDWGPSSGGS